MADTLKKLAGGTLTDISATLYTVPLSTKTIVKEIIMSNKTSSATTVTVTFEGYSIIGGGSIAANDTLIIELHSIMESSAVIAGFAGMSSAVDYYISGIEVS